MTNDNQSVAPVAAGTGTEEIQELRLTDVYEVYGPAATTQGWDFLVCKTMQNALENIETSMDLLEDGEEVKIIFRRYTPAQMDEVVYE